MTQPLEECQTLLLPSLFPTPFLTQVNIYGMAGQYEPHYDMATKGEKAFDEHLGGNRVATLLLYMGNTNAGGATVFVDAGARISTVKVL